MKTWVEKNIRNVEGVEDYRNEVERLCAALVADALASGISPDELDQTVGDLEEYMTDAYEGVIEYDLGFKN